MARSIASSSSFVSAPARLKNSLATRSSVRPLRSMASIVLAKVGGAGSAAMASISARASFSAASKAGSKCRGAMRSKGGASNGAVHGFEERVGVRMRKSHRRAFAVNRGF